MKSSKEVNEISKYFKNSKPSITALNQAKSYIQLAKNISNTEKVLKIKVVFSFSRQPTSRTSKRSSRKITTPNLSHIST